MITDLRSILWSTASYPPPHFIYFYFFPKTSWDFSISREAFRYIMFSYFLQIHLFGEIIAKLFIYTYQYHKFIVAYATVWYSFVVHNSQSQHLNRLKILENKLVLCISTEFYTALWWWYRIPWEMIGVCDGIMKWTFKNASITGCNLTLEKLLTLAINLIYELKRTDNSSAIILL